MNIMEEQAVQQHEHKSYVTRMGSHSVTLGRHGIKLTRLSLHIWILYGIAAGELIALIIQANR